MGRFIIILLIIILIIIISLSVLVRSFGKVFQSFTQQTDRGKNIKKGNKDEVLYNKDDVVILKGDAATKSDTGIKDGK